MLFHHSKKPVELQVIHLNKVRDKRSEQLKSATQDEKPLARLCHLFKKDTKSDGEQPQSKRVYVLDFDGDIKASSVAHLREEISAIISAANTGDEVVLRLESGGGQVTGYGLAAMQLARIKTAGLTLTVCVDKIAASGGYMMACVADKLIAGEFAVIGSIGVVSQLPNFHQWLKEHHIDVEMFTAGKYKRTVTMFGKNDDKDRAKYQSELERIHELFKAHISTHRPTLNIEKIATGEFWLGSDAFALELIDTIGTSDAYIMGLMDAHDVFVLHTRTKPTLAERLGLSEQLSTSLTTALGSACDGLLQRMHKLSHP